MKKKNILLRIPVTHGYCEEQIATKPVFFFRFHPQLMCHTNQSLNLPTTHPSYRTNFAWSPSVLHLPRTVARIH